MGSGTITKLMGSGTVTFVEKTEGMVHKINGIWYDKRCF